MLEEITGHTMRVEVNPAFVRPTDIAVLVGDRTKLASIVGERARQSFRNTLGWMIG